LTVDNLVDLAAPPDCEDCGCSDGPSPCLSGVYLPPIDLAAEIGYDVREPGAQYYIGDPDRPTGAVTTTFRYYPTGIAGLADGEIWLSDCVVLPGLAYFAFADEGRTRTIHNEYVSPSAVHVVSPDPETPPDPVRFLIRQCAQLVDQVAYGQPYGSSGDAPARCAAIVPFARLFGLGDQLDPDATSGTGTAHCMPGWTVVAHSSSPFIACVVGVDSTCDTLAGVPFVAGYNPIRSMTLRDPAAGPSGPVSVCGVVRRPACEGVAGDLIAGATVELQAGDGTPVDSGTSDADGMACFEVSDWGVYRLRATVGSCVGEWTTVAVSGCSPPEIEVPLVVCCGALCLAASGLYADDAETTVDLEGASVTVDGLELGTLATDAEGSLCVELTPAQMLALPPTPGSGCASRRATVRVSKTGWLDRCVTVDIPCGRTLADAEADPTPVTLVGLTTPPPSPVDVFNRLPEALASLCPDSGCSVVGWASRGLVAVGMLVSVDALEYEYYLDPYDHSAGTSWYSLRPTGFAGAVCYLDTDLLDGVAVTPGHSPFGTGQRVEWRAFGSGNWEPRTGGGTYTTHWGLFVTATGARLVLTPVDWDPAASDLPAVLEVPSGLPEAPYLSTDGVMFKMVFDLDICDFVGSDSSVTQTGAFTDPASDDAATGRYRWTIRWVMNQP
jgi:hypothetical protein